jgi:hypothetical protein
LAALLALQPWAADSVVPELSVAPGLGVALGDSTVVSPSRQLAVAPAQPAAGTAPQFAAGTAVAGEGESQPQVGLAAARVAAAPAQSPVAPVQPAPVPAPAPPTPVPAAVPVSAPPPESPPPPAPIAAGTGGEAPGPVAAGGGPVGGGIADVIPVCEGDEYTLSIPPSGAAGAAEALPPEDLARHDLSVVFGSASEGGFYLVLFDGQPIEMGDEPAASESGESCAQVDLGALLGESIEAGAEIRVEAVTLGEEMEPAVP